jgi:hypothetical protein
VIAETIVAVVVCATDPADAQARLVRDCSMAGTVASVVTP